MYFRLNGSKLNKLKCAHFRLCCHPVVHLQQSKDLSHLLISDLTVEGTLKQKNMQGGGCLYISQQMPNRVPLLIHD